jgi:ATP-dependent DNA helicase DinG
MADAANKPVRIESIETVKNLTTEYSTNLRDHFPFAEIRGNQAPALDKLAQWLQDPTKKFFILEGPTGFGKSPVDIACASHAKTTPGYGQFQQGAYILTPQKTLAEQYMKDFSSMGLVELKGRANFTCQRHTHGEEVADCEAGAMMNEATGLEKCDNCPYRIAKDIFVANPFGTTNFAYYLNETLHAGELENRNLLVLDEGHNTEDQILTLTDTTIKEWRCNEYGVGKLPIFNEGENEKVLQWLDKVFAPAAVEHGSKLSESFRATRDEERAKYAKKIKALDNFMQRINMFRNAADQSEWYCWSDWNAKRRMGTGDLYIKPLTARLFADDMLFNKAQKILITSATILDFGTFMQNLGISRQNAVTMAVNSEFPVENRPIFYNPVGSMSYNNGIKTDHIDVTLPKMAREIEKLLTRYAANKGIIHTNSYKINKYIVDYLKTTQHASRVITHDSAKGAREKAQADHINSPEPTVLISPSMTEGLDLKDDLSRFQILCKVPYPALDPYVRARMRRTGGQEWYAWQTSLKLVQATGRSNRHKNDQADTYILDSDFAQFIGKNNRRLPKYWLDAIVWPQVA